MCTKEIAKEDDLLAFLPVYLYGRQICGISHSPDLEVSPAMFHWLTSLLISLSSVLLDRIFNNKG